MNKSNTPLDSNSPTSSTQYASSTNISNMSIEPENSMNTSTHYTSSAHLISPNSPLKDLSNCILGEKIADGFFGSVFLGFWNNSKVALKSLNEDNTETNIKLFIHEAEILDSIKSPNIVQIFGFCKISNVLYFCMEYMEKGNLLNFLKESNLEFPQLLKFAIEAVLPLIALQNNEPPIIHRDISARNYLIGPNYHIKMADFGMARLMKEENYFAKTGHNFPIRWSAPEIITKNIYSTQSDIWSFGILCFEIFSEGEIPFVQYSTKELIEMFALGLIEPRRPSKCVEDCWVKCIVPCFQKIPKTRPNSQEIYESLLKFEKGT